ncbi:hypothetical protein GJ496_006224 [Pomphorhynchus laevis]|nr:hypothetical protein GJ496_006224 [Pomphorhynchus laevis]
MCKDRMNEDDSDILDYRQFYRTIKGSGEKCSTIIRKVHGFCIYRQLTTTGLYEYRAEALLVNFIDCDRLHKILYDVTMMKSFNSKIHNVQIIKDDSSKNTQVIYCEVKFPWYMFNRAYLIAQTHTMIERNNSKIYLGMQQNARNEIASLAQISSNVSDCIQVNDFYSYIALIQHKNCSTIHIRHYENPNSDLPKCCINKLLMKSFVNYLISLKQVLNSRYFSKFVKSE